jgi:hypothetical protein
MPANNESAATFREVAIVPFTGRGGMALSSELEAMLAGIKVGQHPYFKLADRMQLQSIIDEIKLSHSGMLSDDAIVKIGKLAGVKGIYTGVVTTNETSAILILKSAPIRSVPHTPPLPAVPNAARYLRRSAPAG